MYALTALCFFTPLEVRYSSSVSSCLRCLSFCAPLGFCIFRLSYLGITMPPKPPPVSRAVFETLAAKGRELHAELLESIERRGHTYVQLPEIALE